MKLTRIDYPHNLKHTPAAACFGYFDGLHIGHQALVNKTLEEAKKHKIKASLCTFEPNPNFVLGKIKKEEMLTTLNDRYLKLKQMGMDEMMIIKFSSDVAKLTCIEFIEEFIVKLNIKVVVVGFDFHFGYKGSGDARLLKELAASRYEVIVINEIDDEGIKISSSRIVSLVKSGEIEKANYLLGEPYTVKGKVIKGFGRGRKMSFPTINIKTNQIYIYPLRGVYACRVKVNNIYYYGMANIGVHPTIDKLESDLLEVNIFDFNEYVYNKKVEVSFYKFIRSEQQFTSLDLLIQQLQKDKDEIKKYFKI